MGKSESQGYITPHPRAKIDVDYPKNFRAQLVTNKDELKEFLHTISKSSIVAIDTETNSTDWGYGHIVGMSASVNSTSGWYLPFRHELYERNIPLKILQKVQEIIQNKFVLMYNACFDITMLQKEGMDFSKVSVMDVMNLTYLMDTNIHLPSLKESALHYLGRQSPTFDETLKGREHFGFIPPDEAVFYAASDTGNTFGLFQKLTPRIKQECPQVLKLDNMFVKVLLKLCTIKLPVRQELLEKLETYYTTALTELEKDIFKAVGYPFNIRSNTQLVTAFKQLNIKTGYTTDKGNMSVKAEVLELIQEKYPFVKSIVKYKSMASTLSSMKKFRGLDYIRCNYEMHNTVTGRLSSGSAKEEGKLNLPKGVRPFHDKFNAQNFLKSKEIYYKLYEAPDDPYAILGYRFKPIEKNEIQPTDKIVECMDYKGNTRRLINCCKRDENGCIIHDERDRYWVKNDYSGAELKLATIFSKEPVLMKAFIDGIDPHTNTAKAMFGLTDKPHRAKAKTCNFSLLYEGSADSLSRNSGLSYAEADELWHKYWETMRVLRNWKVLEQKNASVSGVCRTFMGRPRRLRWYFCHPKLSMRSFGKRSVISHEIQGSLGDIIKLSLIKSCEQIFDSPEWKDDVDLYMTIHDEIDAGVSKNRLFEYIDTMDKICTIQLPGWEIPLVTDFDVGYSYGFVVGVKKLDDGTYGIKYKMGSDIIG